MSHHILHREQGFRRRNQSGLSIIELMIALVLGLVVVGAAGGVFMANRRVYAASETLNRVQENGRVSFELMTRDIREAAGSPCGQSSTMVNLLAGSQNTWWDLYSDGVRGYEGGSGPESTGTKTIPVTGAWAGTDAIDLFGGTEQSGERVITNQSTPSAVVGVTSTAGLAENDIAIACNTKFTLVFQITGVNSSSLSVGHNGGQGNPGNCGQNFQHVSPGGNCSGASGGNTYCFTPPNSSTSNSCNKFDNIPAVLTKVGGVRWYVGNNNRGSRSLYRAVFDTKAVSAAPTVASTEEIAEGIMDMQIRYRLQSGGTWLNASSITTSTDWKNVVAVEVKVRSEGVRGALQGAQLRGTDDKALSREYTHVVALRNREGTL